VVASEDAMPSSIRNLVAEINQLTEQPKEAKTPDEVEKATGIKPPSAYDPKKNLKSDPNTLPRTGPKMTEKGLSFAGMGKNPNPEMDGWISRINTANVELVVAKDKKLYGEEITDEMRRLAGIVECDNSSLLESRLSPTSAESKIYQKNPNKPVKA
jgi:hypothetical protein